jgi:hypothetical protein
MKENTGEFRLREINELASGNPVKPKGRRYLQGGDGEESHAAFAHLMNKGNEEEINQRLAQQFWRGSKGARE